MKKIIGVIIAVLVIMPNIVKADTLIIPSTYNKQDYIVDTTKYNTIMSYYNQNVKNTKQYYIYQVLAVEGGDFYPTLYAFNNINQAEIKAENGTWGLYMEGSFTKLQIDGLGQVQQYDNTFGGIICTIGYEGNIATDEEIALEYYDSNINLTINYQNFPYNEIEVEDFYTDNIILENGSIFPKTKDLLEYNNYSDYENNNLTDYQEVDLNNYDYVLLTLKNYNNKTAFDTNLQVKGQIGITPIYNYGQTSKDEVTGVKVQDRCNVNYDNYTSYPLYVLQQDLQNNVIYAVKSCQENSSFKYDTNIFNIFYVTQSNREDPTVTINGQTYHTIPFSDLPSTANKNEEENYIPGQSGSINDTGGLDGAVKGVQQKMGEIWDTFTYFTDLINQIFSTLPQELRIILVSAFVIAIILGLIKIFIN